MPEGDVYFAIPGRLQAGVRQIDQISSLVQDIARDFVSEVNAVRDWPGRDDSFAREVLPQEKDERETATRTAEAIAEAVVEIANGTHDNLRNIVNTQDGALDAIGSAARGRRGSH
ncbi:hypothetical protein [Streptomyces sp. NPDC058579]|uniref:hypothetical protein n=1 Tax=Streptomyces sp. NPDC058579 TaxID=3346548 RepID=UPI003659FB43